MSVYWYTSIMKTKTPTHTLNIRREDLSEYGLSLGIWEILTDDMGLPANTSEVEITISAARKVA